jgi:hypothetical protein
MLMAVMVLVLVLATQQMIWLAPHWFDAMTIMILMMNEMLSDHLSHPMPAMMLSYREDHAVGLCHKKHER